MIPAPSNQNVGVKIGNAMIPPEGPKAIPYQLDFTAQTAYRADLTNLYQNNIISALQTAYVDNSANGKALKMSVEATGQVIFVPPYTEGYFPILSPNTGGIVFATTGGALVSVYLINVPMPAASWNPNALGTENQEQFDLAGNLMTSDQGLKAVTDPVAGVLVRSAGGFGSAPAQTWGQFNCGQRAVNAQDQILAKPAGMNFLNITAFSVNLSSDAVPNAAGFMGMAFWDQGAPGVRLSPTFGCYLPAGAANTPGIGPTVIPTESGVSIKFSVGANFALSCQGAQFLTAGVVIVTMAYYWSAA